MTSPEYDVAVLGGGIAGLTIARELLLRDLSVVVLRSSLPAASPMAAGMLAPMPELTINPGLGRLAVEALHFYPEFLSLLAADTEQPAGFLRSGVLRVARGGAEADALREGVGAYEAAGMPSRWLSPAACLRQVEGLAAGGLAGGLLSYDEAQVQPAWLLAALEDAIGRRGGAFLDAEVGSLEPADGRVVVVIRGEPVVPPVGGRLAVGRAVLAMGSWTANLPGLDYLVRPVKGQLLTYPAGTPGPGPIVYWGHNYLVTKADGTVVLGATMEEAGYSITVDGKADELRRLGEEAWPALAGAVPEVKAGLRPAAPDGLPVVGPLPEIRGTYVFSAHFRNGFLLCPLSAKLAAGEIAGEGAAGLFETMRPARLKSAPPAEREKPGTPASEGAV